MTRDFAPLDPISLYRDEVLSILGRNGLASPRLDEPLASGADTPTGTPFPLRVDDARPAGAGPADLGRVEHEIAALVGRPVRLVVDSSQRGSGTGSLTRGGPLP